MNKQMAKRMQRALLYKAAPGAGYNDKQAQEIGAELECLRQRGMALTPPNIVAQARPEDSPLHSYFEWRDPIAAENWRRYEARNLVNHLLVVTFERKQELRQKAHYSVVIEDRRKAGEEDDTENDDETRKREYVPVQRVATEDYLREQQHENALRDLRAWAFRYEPFHFEDLEPVLRFAVGSKESEEPIPAFSVVGRVEDKVRLAS